MPEINIEQAHEFLNKISDKDNVAIIHHDDGDGFCSAILFYDRCKSKGAKVKTFPYNLSKTNLAKLQLNTFNKIIITDISTKSIQESIKSLTAKQIFVTDHHPKFPLPNSVLQLLTSDEGYIPSSRTAYELTKKKKWLAVIGMISDAADLYKENEELINNFLKEQNISLEKFQTKYIYPITDTIIYLKETPEKIFPLLSEISSLEEIEKLKKYSRKIQKILKKYIKKYKEEKEEIGNISLFYYETELSINKPLIDIITREFPEKVHVFLSKKEDKIQISTRDQSEKIGVNKLLEYATKNLPDSKFGGHKRASGGQIRAQDLEKFKKNIKNYVTK